MPNPSVTLETLALEVGRALDPLADELDTGLFDELGVELPRAIADNANLLASLDAARTKAGELRPKKDNLAQAIAGGDAITIATTGAALIAGLAELVTAFRTIGSAVVQAAGALTPDQRAALEELAGRLPVRALEAALVRYLGQRSPSLAMALDALGLIDGVESSAEMEVRFSSPESVTPRLHLDRLLQLLRRPDQYLQQTFGWGAANFDGIVLLRKLQALLENLGVPAAIYQSPNRPPSLEAFAFVAQADTSVTPPGLKFELSLPGDVTFDQTIDFSPLWKGTMHVDAHFAAGVEALLRPPFDITVRPPSGNFVLHFLFGLQADGTDAAPLTLFGATTGPTLRAKRIGASVGVDADLSAAGGTVTPAIKFRVDGGKLLLNSGSGDSFTQEVLSRRDVSLGFDLAADWNVREGLRLQGNVGGEAFIPVQFDLPGARINGIYLSVASTPSAALEVSASTQVTTRLGPLSAVIDRIGVKGAIDFPQDGGNLGVADLALGFKPPSGVGLSVDAGGVVTGGGFLFHDRALGLYAGAMQLSLRDQITLKAFGLISTRMPDGSPGYSLIVFITAEDFRPIPLGLGFTLLGIGGMIGVNRTFDQDVLRQGLKSGTLATLLFPRDPVGNAPTLIRNLASAFPARRGSYLLGLLAKIGWFTPTLIFMDLALILEFGARTRLLALGRISALLPSADNDLVRLNMEALGVLDFDAGTAAIDAELIDSRLAHKFPITGSAAMRAGFASGPSFILAVGGLNPRFAPPAGFPTLARVAIALSSGNNPRLLCEAYFAITSNTVQFGAQASLYASAAGFSVEGAIGYDVLLQLLPLHFIADFHARLQLKRGSRNLFMVALAGELEGPRPLRVSGKATFSILWCDFSVRFDTTLVSGDPPPLPPAVDVLAQLTQALVSPTSWSTQRSAAQPHGVALKSLPPAVAGAPLVLDPLGLLVVKQQVAPLNTGRDIDTFGGAPVAGARRFTLGATLNGAPLASAPQREFFAPAQFFVMSDEEKIAAPSFEPMDAGYTFGTPASATDSSQVIAAPLEYQTITIGGTPASATAPTGPVVSASYTLSADQLRSMARTGSAGRAPVRHVGQARFRNASVQAAKLNPERWSIMPRIDGTAPPVDPSVRTWSEHQAALGSLNRAAARWQLLPTYEIEL